jgi:hypothetical protein
MKINLQTVNRENFRVDTHILGNEIVYLIQPCHIGAKWDKDTLYFRSSLWDEDGNLVSMSFPKFFNWGEQPELSPVPTSLKDCVCVEKLDGSTLIVSKYKGNFILRTRGTVDASKLDNGYELGVFKQKYPLVFEYQPHFATWPFSLLFEWTSPENRIVIRYGDEPEFSLVGGINHDTGKLWMQDALNAIANTWGCPRPKVYSFDSISDLLTLVDGWQGKEGVCVYSNLGQAIHKVKSADYLCKHRLKEEFCNFERVLDFYIAEGCPEFGDFQTRVSEVTDWETATELKKDISKLCDAWKEVLLISNHMKEFVKPLKLVSRKDAAQKIISSYGNSNRASFCFSILDGKELTKDQNKKLLWQVLKK